VKRSINLLFICMAVLAPFLPNNSARANDLAKVSCDGFALGYDGEADSKICMTADAAKGRGEGNFSQLQVKTKQVFLLVQYTEAKFLNYIPYRPLRDYVTMNKSFGPISDWEPLPDSRGYHVAEFQAALSGKNGNIVCAVFTQFRVPAAGHYEYEDGPGYREAVIGYYCPQDQFPSTEAGSDWMKDLNDALGRIRTPPT
jgi:hypothetical protein